MNRPNKEFNRAGNYMNKQHEDQEKSIQEIT